MHTKIKPILFWSELSSKHFKCCLHATTLEKWKVTVQKMIGRCIHWCFSDVQHKWEQTTFQQNGWMGNRTPANPIRMKAFGGNTGETQQGRSPAQNFSLLKMFQFPETAIYNHYKEIVKSVSNWIIHCCQISVVSFLAEQSYLFKSIATETNYHRNYIF